MTSTAVPVVTLSGPADALQAIPHLLGFRPSGSLVLLAMSGPRCQVVGVTRVDLEEASSGDSADAAVVTLALDVMTERSRAMGADPAERLIAVVYTDEGGADPWAPLPRLGLAAALRGELAQRGIGLKDLLVVRHGRWFSLHCDDPECCPSDGTPLVEEIPSAAALALRMELGSPLPSRDALAAAVADRSAPGSAAEIEALACELGELDTTALALQALDVADHASACVEDGVGPEHATVVLLAALAQRTPVRDALVMSVADDQLIEAVRLWTLVLAACPPPFDAEVGAILGYLAWQSGLGSLAHAACGRVLATDPDHRLAALILQALAHNLMPGPGPTRPRGRFRGVRAPLDPVRAARRGGPRRPRRRAAGER